VVKFPANLTEYVAQLNRRLRVPGARERAGHEAGLIALLIGDAQRAVEIWTHVDAVPELRARVAAALRCGGGEPTSPKHLPTWRSDLAQVLYACSNEDSWNRRIRLAWWYRTTANHVDDLAILIHWTPVLKSLMAGDLAPALNVGYSLAELLENAANMQAGEATLIPGIDDWRILLADHGELNEPASVDEIGAAEDRLGLTFSESYRSFLQSTNGFEPAGLRPVQEIGWFRIEYPESVDMFHVEEEPSVPDEEYFVYGRAQDCALFRPEYLQTALIVGDTTADKALLLNPAVSSPVGEMEAWDFSLWLPAADRFPSFKAMVVSRLAR
jgi:hypothetical protein